MDDPPVLTVWGRDIPDSQRITVQGRDRHRCTRCGLPAPNGHLHHRRSRSVRDGHRHCACNLVLLCARCHVWVHKFPLLARHDRLILSKFTQVPGSEPVTSNTGVRWLGCDGSLRFED